MGIMPAMHQKLAALLAASAFSCQAAGTLVKTVAEFDAAVMAASPGDTIILAEGEWKDVDLKFKAAGVVEKPITVKAEIPGKTILTGSSRLRLGGEHLVIEGLWFRDPAAESGEVIEFRIDSKLHASHSRATNCAVTSSTSAKKQKGSRWVSMHGTDNRVDHCWLEGKTSEGATLVVWLGFEPEGRHRIDHNFFGPRPVLGKNGGETIRIGDSKTSLRDARCIIERNWFDRCNGEGEIISNKSCSNIYRQNLFSECEGALTLRHGHRCLVEGNWFRGNGRKLTGGVRIIGEDHRVVNNYLDGLRGDEFRSGITFMNGIPDTPLNGYSQVKRAFVAFNTLAGCEHPILIGMTDDKKCSLPPAGSVIANNIVVAETSPPVEAMSDASGIRWVGNLMSGPRWEHAGDGIRWADVKLEKQKDGVWRPAAGSPAIDSAVKVDGSPQSDIHGQPRDAKPDAGCDESSPSPATIKMMTRAEAGPDWKR